MKLPTLILSLSAVLILTSGVALAQPVHTWQDGEARKMRIQSPLQQLALTPEQREQLATLMQQHRAKQHAQRTQPAMQALMDAPQFDELTAKQVLTERAQQREQRQLARLALQHEIQQLLTPEQRQQLAELRAQPKSRPQSKQQQRLEQANR